MQNEYSSLYYVYQGNMVDKGSELELQKIIEHKGKYWNTMDII